MPTSKREDFVPKGKTIIGPIAGPADGFAIITGAALYSLREAFGHSDVVLYIVNEDYTDSVLVENNNTTLLAAGGHLQFGAEGKKIIKIIGSETKVR